MTIHCSLGHTEYSFSPSIPAVESARLSEVDAFLRPFGVETARISSQQISLRLLLKKEGADSSADAWRGPLTRLHSSFIALVRICTPRDFLYAPALFDLLLDMRWLILSMRSGCRGWASFHLGLAHGTGGPFCMARRVHKTVLVSCGFHKHL